MQAAAKIAQRLVFAFAKIVLGVLREAAARLCVIRRVEVNEIVCAWGNIAEVA